MFFLPGVLLRVLRGLQAAQLPVGSVRGRQERGEVVRRRRRAGGVRQEPHGHGSRDTGVLRGGQRHGGE